jgi:hypothetical protein
MKDIKLMYESLLNEHRRIQNLISEIKSGSYDLNSEEKRRVQELEQTQVNLMRQMKSLFDKNRNK